MEITVKKQIIGKKLLNNYDTIFDFEEGLACVKKDGKYGYINKNGEEVLELVFDNASDFENSLAYIEKDGKGYFINKKGKKQVYIMIIF